MKFLKCHPFPVAARFDRVLAFSFAFPEETLRPFVDDGLRIDSFQGLGFITVALVWTRQLRPAGLPRFMGRDFFLAGYRVFTSLRDESGRKLRGLKIIGSETDKRGMVFWGNLMTEYKYKHVGVQSTSADQVTRLVTAKDDGQVSLDIRYDAETVVVEDSSFLDTSFSAMREHQADPPAWLGELVLKALISTGDPESN